MISNQSACTLYLLHELQGVVNAQLQGIDPGLFGSPKTGIIATATADRTDTLKVMWASEVEMSPLEVDEDHRWIVCEYDGRHKYIYRVTEGCPNLENKGMLTSLPIERQEEKVKASECGTHGWATWTRPPGQVQVQA